MKVIIPLVLALLVSISNATAQGPDPISVIRGYMAAFSASNVDAAVAFFADDAVITNPRGIEITGQDAIRRLIQSALSAGPGGEGEAMIDPRVTGDAVTWAISDYSGSFVRLGVAPIERRRQGVVQNGKIKSIDNYFSPQSLAKVQRACERPQTQGILVFGQSCSDFLQQAKAHTRSVAANFKPYTAETDFMSLQGYLSPLNH